MPQHSISRLRSWVELPQNWAEEQHIEALASMLDIHIRCTPVEILHLEGGFQAEAARTFNEGGSNYLHILWWTRGDVGLHFDVLEKEGANARKKCVFKTEASRVWAAKTAVIRTWGSAGRKPKNWSIG